MGHVGAEPPRLGVPEQGVQVGAVHVHLAAGVVHLGAQRGDAGLVHPVGRGVGHHDRGEPVGVRRDLGVEVDQVDVAVGVAGHHDHPHAGHHRAGGVGAVRRLRDQAHVAPVVAARAVVGPDRQQAGQLALGAGVGLDGDRVVPGDGGEPALQGAHQRLVARGLRRRGERVDVGELRPAHRLHLGGRVELHRARAQRDHAPVQRVVPVGQAAQVAQHRRLGVVRGEHRMREEVATAGQCRRQCGRELDR